MDANDITELVQNGLREYAVRNILYLPNRDLVVYYYDEDSLFGVGKLKIKYKDVVKYNLQIESPVKVRSWYE